MQLQLERLAKLTVDYRRKTALTQKRSQSLIQEKAELQAQLLDKEQQITQIKDNIVDAETPESPSVSQVYLFAFTIIFSGGSFQILSLALSMAVVTRRFLLFSKANNGETSFVGKMVIDMSDPNRPRFTLNELRHVLTERNELKTKLIEVEEELQTYKPNKE